MRKTQGLTEERVKRMGLIRERISYMRKTQGLTEERVKRRGVN